MSEKKGFTQLDLGTTGKIVAKNVAHIRQALGYSYARLATELERPDIGYKISVMGLRRIEANARHVSVDDVFALARVLGVTPARLLTDGTEKPFATAVPSDVSYVEFNAWMHEDLQNFDPSTRLFFWHQRKETIEATLPRLNERLERIKEAHDADPEDIHMRKGLAHAKRELLRANESIAEATEMSEFIRAMHPDSSEVHESD